MSGMGSAGPPASTGIPRQGSEATATLPLGPPPLPSVRRSRMAVIGPVEVLGERLDAFTAEMSRITINCATSSTPSSPPGEVLPLGLHGGRGVGGPCRRMTALRKLDIYVLVSNSDTDV